jgi:hypothetical protein
MESVSGTNLIANGHLIEADSAESWKKVKQVSLPQVIFQTTGRDRTGFLHRF